MLLELPRKTNGDEACLGMIYVDGVPECVTLEDPVRDLGPDGAKKQYGKTAIPAGKYRVVIDFSPKFQKNMIHILDVPYFTGIRIHSGNDADDTLGCILVGEVIDGPNHIHGGSIALPRLFKKIELAIAQHDEVWINITDEFKESV